MSGQIPDLRQYDQAMTMPVVRPAARNERTLTGWAADHGYTITVTGGLDCTVTITRAGVTQVFRGGTRDDAIGLAAEWATEATA